MALSPLKQNLRMALVTSQYRGSGRFIPHLQRQRICNIEAVQRELQRLFPKSDSESNRKSALLICQGQSQNTPIASKPCLNIFAILVLLGKAHLIKSFQDHPLCDDDLPLYSSSDFTKLWSSKKGGDHYLEFPNDGHDEFIEDFIRQQWSVLAPSFDAPTAEHIRCNFYTFEEKTILPIVHVSEKSYHGGFGTVEQVQIHDEHNGFKHKVFALKTMHPWNPKDTEKFFRQELDAFNNARPGGHIIEICAAFKKGESYSFLFPWADGGNLTHLWNRHPSELIASRQMEWSDFNRWICVQCHGIIRDLRAIHGPHDTSPGIGNNNGDDLYGIHSDIKPVNILHFTEDGPLLGTLKVSDLGLMKFHRLISRTIMSKSMGNAYQTYRAPEHDLGMVRSRKIDIWAFGCLFAEFLTWAILGQNGIEKFQTIRLDEDKLFPDKDKGEWAEDNFFIMSQGTLAPFRVARRKSSVDEWFTDLAKEFGTNTFIPQFLQYIQDSMLEPDRNARAGCQEVEEFLEKCLKSPANSPYWDFPGMAPYQNGYSGSTTESSVSD